MSNIKTMITLMLTSLLATLVLGGSANGYSSSVIDETSCQVHAAETCHEPGDGWAQGPCHSVYGGFRGNSDAMHKVMLEHFQDSFRYLVMGSHFSSDEVNRLGMNNLMDGLSDKMWNRGKDTMKYILKRGGRMGSHFKVFFVAITENSVS